MTTTVTICDMDEYLEKRLHMQAARHGRSMEDEAHEILHSVLSAEPEQGQPLVDAIRARIAPLGGVGLDLPVREAIWNSPEFDK